MSSIGKSEKFRQNENFKCLLQPSMQEVFRTDYVFKGKWNSDVFKNNNPITLELGCGKGEYTIALAEKYPQRNFIGIDIKGARLWKGAKYVENNKLSNVIFIRTSIDFIEWIFAKDEIAEIWITFADPQMQSPRKRLTGTLFLQRYNKFLIPGGIIHLKTDSRFLHEYTKAIAEQNKCKILACSSDIYAEAQKGNTQNFPPELLTVQTFYEKFFLSQGLKITYLAFLLPLDIKQFSEPAWNKDFWKSEEEKGRTKKNIR
ncbi:MAG: tRNA (guanosine(46)-N7)-methyltransferase TrmB [Bacteroidales bacterium]|jgi:tRNA (guanine-N7-)-methyltransferase|nr:tRNA (guanosine(46)-N7)-methyltransferase TrmB [Bacteroidales bacterium]MCI1732910.1 tRNA (guanosine(46)-N7)-methyltransferase TrmB [Bacteroidales bacterium]